MRVNIKVHARSKRESVTPQPDGSLKVLVSCFKTAQDDLAFSLDPDDISAKQWKLTVVDVDGEVRELTQEIRSEKDRLVFEKASGSMTIFAELIPC